MHYLEDALDLLDGIPEEIKRQCYEIRELDSRTEKAFTDVRNESRAFFDALASISEEERAVHCKKIKKAYAEVREMSEEKLVITEFLELMLEKYYERIAKDLNEFKMELELDTPGITSSIENGLCAAMKNSNSHKRAFKLSVEASGGKGRDFGADEQKYHVSPNLSARVKHGTDTNMTDPNLSVLTDDKSSLVLSCSSRNKEGFRKPNRTFSLNMSPANLAEHKEKRQKLMSSYKSVVSSLMEAGDGEMSPSESQSSIYQRYTLNKASANDGGSIASSSTSTTPSPPISSAGNNAKSLGHQSYTFSGGTYLSSSNASGTMPAFANSQESQYGRPVKLTTRVQQMLKDRQLNRGNRSLATASPVFHHADGQLESQESHTHSDLIEDEELEISEDDAENSMSEIGEDIAMDEEGEEGSEDQDSHVWCICQEKSEGDMVACDNKKCPYEWFHYGCVGITAPPRGKWYCPECSVILRRSRSMESR